VARRSGLGKGLSSLIPTEVVREGTSMLQEVPLSSIRPNPLQPRTHFDEETLVSLAASIREVGVLQPILVRQAAAGEFEIIAGERRWRAARRAGLQTVPALVQETVSDVSSLEQALVENLQRADLNALEEAAAYQHLIDEFGLTHELVATRVGRSRSTVTNTLRLLQLPAGVQRALADGAISAGHARALLGTPDRALQEALAKQIVAEGLNVRAVEDIVRRHAQDEDDEDVGVTATAPVSGAGAAPGPTSTSPVRRLPAPGVLELEELLSDFLNTRVKVDVGGRRGRVLIDFATLEDLERIYKLMVGGAAAPG
jgi:ParB family transcriptional regulator, chromosome partitioning protein